MLSRLLTRREQGILAGVAGAIVIGSAVLYFQPYEQTADVVIVPAADVKTAVKEPPAVAVVPAIQEAAPPPAVPEAPPKELGVAVMGAIRSEGFYTLPENSRVADLIKAAGGASADADLATFNLSARLIDATTLTIPLKSSNPYQTPTFNPPQYLRSYQQAAAQASAPDHAAPHSFAPGNRSTASSLVNLNTASQQELETLPGIGPALASRIISYRTQQPFRTVEDLDNVSGFGEARMATLRPLVTVR